jgi:glycosyltransferase 2 family protein
MQSFSRYLFPGLVALFAAACLYGLRGDIAQVSLAPLMHAWDLVALAVLCSLLNYAVRIVRWQRYLAKLGRSLPLGFIALTYLAGFAFTVSPGKVGEMARARYYSRLGVSLADVAGAFFVERLMDVMAMMVLAALIVAALPAYHLVMWSAGGVVIATLIMLALLPWNTIATRVPTWTQLPRIVIRLGVGVAQALAAARSLLSPGALLLGFVLGLAGWGLEGVGLYALGSMFPTVHLAPSTGVGIYAVAVLAGAVSFLPGGLGSTEAVMTTLLAAQGLAVGDALLMTIVCRLVTLWLAVLIGWGAVFTLRNRMTPVVSSWP